MVWNGITLVQTIGLSIGGLPIIIAYLVVAIVWRIVMGLIVGSVALNHILGRCVREPKDLDILTLVGEADDLYCDQTYPNNRVEKLNIPASLRSSFRTPIDGVTRFATLDELYTVKVSHSYWELKNGSWGKHIYDIILLQEAGATLIEPLHDELYLVWESIHGKKRVNLQMSSGDFFGKDAVHRIYDHDSIHESVAYGDTALYNLVLKEGEDVSMDMAKLKALPLETRILLFREEVYATALERILLPRAYSYSAGAAYLWALRRTITSLTKGWSAKFIVQHIREFIDPRADAYLSRHLSKKHKLIPLEGK